MIAFTSIHLGSFGVLVEPMPNGGYPHGSISEASAICSQGAEKVSACRLPSRKFVLNEAENPSNQAMLPIVCDCQSERP